MAPGRQRTCARKQRLVAWAMRRWERPGEDELDGLEVAGDAADEELDDLEVKGQEMEVDQEPGTG